MFDLPFQLPPNWEITTVGELVKRGIIEKPLDGNHGGTHPKSSDYVATGIPFVMASDLDAGRVTFETCKFIPIEQAKTLRKGFSKEGDVLISHKATIGRTAIVQKNEFEFLMLTPQVTYYRVKDYSKLNNIYLKAYFDSSYFQTILNLWAGAGSTRAYLGITDQLKLPVILPTLEAQLYIADISLKFNNKIHLNTQTNQTLESIAQAIFKSWFVDFEPVKAKMATLAEGGTHEQVELAAMGAISGKSEAELAQLQQQNPEHYQQLAETAALFPSAMVESELGEIPEGWEVRDIDSVTSLIIDHRGKTPKKLGGDWVDAGYPALSAKNIKQGRIVSQENIRFLSKEIYSKWMREEVKKGDVLLTSEAPMGEMLFLTNETKYCLSQRLYAIRANNKDLTPSYLYLWLQTPVAQSDLAGRATGTTVVGIRQSELRKVNVLTAGIKLSNSLEDLVFPLFKQLQELESQNLALAQLRDSLLPKLLSGEIDLSDIQSEVA